MSNIENVSLLLDQYAIDILSNLFDALLEMKRDRAQIKSAFST